MYSQSTINAMRRFSIYL